MKTAPAFGPRTVFSINSDRQEKPQKQALQKQARAKTESTVQVPIPRSDLASFFRLAHPPRQPEETLSGRAH
jgi:hypothetical protein